jgi:hypothetical protein
LCTRLNKPRAQEIAAWRMALFSYRFDATPALRQVLSRAVGTGSRIASACSSRPTVPPDRRQSGGPRQTDSPNLTIL